MRQVIVHKKKLTPRAAAATLRRRLVGIRSDEFRDIVSRYSPDMLETQSIQDSADQAPAPVTSDIPANVRSNGSLSSPTPQPSPLPLTDRPQLSREE